MQVPVLDIAKLSARAIAYTGSESYQNCSNKAKVEAKVKAGQDIHFVYKGQCVGVFRRAWAAAGINIPGMNGCGTPSAYMALLRCPGRAWYQEIPVSNLSNPVPGDVVLYHGGSTVGHGALYIKLPSGAYRWCSDAIQRGWNVYKNAYDVCLFRYRGKINVDGNVGFASGTTSANIGENIDWNSIESELAQLNELLMNDLSTTEEFIYNLDPNSTPGIT